MSLPRIIAFYLPQYHPIPENDEWWGKGFTDWTNVVKGRPLFRGQYQPHVPAELGYYDLTNEEIRAAQATMASEHGVEGFCYYHYWFNEKMLLERPFNEVLSSGKPDFPFCLCWANENWTRKWDGAENELLMGQNYEEYDAEKHMEWLSGAFADRRYIKILNKPLFLVYRAGSIPNIEHVVRRWRTEAHKRGLDGLYLCSVNSWHNKFNEKDLKHLGFDAAVDFLLNPHNLPTMKLISAPGYYSKRIYNKLLKVFGLDKRIGLLRTTDVYDYKAVADLMIKKPTGQNEFTTFPCVSVGFDNIARKKISTLFLNNTPEIYEHWLDKTFEKAMNHSPNERIIFVIAWNEWAEGCHLEPDSKWGKKFLEATLRVVNKWKAIGNSQDNGLNSQK